MKTSRFKKDALEIIAVPVLSDNFVYLVCRGSRALLVDAGDAPPVKRELETNGLTLERILLTHGHSDHTGGLAELKPLCSGGDTDDIAEIREIPTPGHTVEDKAFYFPEAAAVFTGDCLINGACGRMFGGTAAQLFDSLQKIKQLPGDTLVFGGHDYLEDNLLFALSVEPENTAVRDRLELYQDDPAAALFMPLSEEIKSNPFLRAETADAFADLRRKKDRF